MTKYDLISNYSMENSTSKKDIQLEELRNKNLLLKKEVEKARKEVEQARKDVEQARKDAEQARKDAENATEKLLNSLNQIGGEKMVNFYLENKYNFN